MSGLIGLKLAAGALFRPVGAIASKIPPRVWLIIGGVAACLLGVWWHQHHAHSALKAQYAAGYAQRGSDDIAAANKLKAQLDAANAKITADERKLNDEENRRIAGAADALRLSGPGRASCRPASAPVPSSGPKPASSPSDAAGPPLPSDDGQSLLTGVPWPWLVNRAEEHDLDRAEVVAWRDWYAKLKAGWPKE